MRNWLAAAFLLAASLPASAQSVIVARQIEQTHPLDLATLPSVEVSVAFQTGSGPQQGRFRGPLLWSVIEASDMIPEGEGKTRTSHSVVVTGRDGYKALLGLAEIDPDFEDKQVVLATMKDGQKIGAGELRLVVPGDKHGARNVRDVVRIEVR